MDLTWLKTRTTWFFGIGVPRFFERIKSAVWNRGIKLHLDRRWIRKGENHPSLGVDPMAIRYMSREQKRVYFKDLARRVNISHDRDMAKDLEEAKQGAAS